MKTLTLLALLALAPTPGIAGKLFACRDASGHLSFVDHGCPGTGERREIPLPATAKGAQDADAAQIARWDKASRARLPTSLGGSARAASTPRANRRSSRIEPADACSRARAERTKAERERSFSLSFDERRRLSDAVRFACGLR